jgi:hypothetical protein
MRTPFEAARVITWRPTGFILAVIQRQGQYPAFVGLFADEVTHLQPRIRLGAYPISCGGVIVEGVDALKGAIRPLSLDRPLIVVAEDNVKDRLLRALGHLDAIANNNDGLETIPYPSGGHQVAQKGLRFSRRALLQPLPRHPRKCRVVSATEMARGCLNLEWANSILSSEQAAVGRHTVRLPATQYRYL